MTRVREITSFGSGLTTRLAQHENNQIKKEKLSRKKRRLQFQAIFGFELSNFWFPDLRCTSASLLAVSQSTVQRVLRAIY